MKTYHIAQEAILNILQSSIKESEKVYIYVCIYITESYIYNWIIYV